MRRRIRREIGWFVHNMYAHPLSEVVHLVGLLTPGDRLERLSNWIHDATIPDHKAGTGRG